MSMYFSALEVARTLETGATVGILMVLVVDLFIVAWNRGAMVPPPRQINSQKCTRQTIPHPYGFWDSGSVLVLALESIRE